MAMRLSQQGVDKNIIAAVAQISAEEMEPIISEAGDVVKD
jgi:hypothetical protein